jgi:hypothetical protein
VLGMVLPVVVIGVDVVSPVVIVYVVVVDVDVDVVMPPPASPAPASVPGRSDRDANTERDGCSRNRSADRRIVD